MQNNDPDRSEERFKEALYGAFAEVTKALSNPKRLAILDRLLQRPHRVDELVTGLGWPLSTISQHLQVLRRSHLVEAQRHHTSITYRLAPGVAPVFVQMRRLAETLHPDVQRAKDRFFRTATIDIPTAQARLRSGDAMLIDVRPRDEYAAGHVPGALCVPLEELDARLPLLPPDRLIVAMCRGPACVFAEEAVRRLRAAGREAVRCEASVADWSLGSRSA